MKIMSACWLKAKRGAPKSSQIVRGAASALAEDPPGLHNAIAMTGGSDLKSGEAGTRAAAIIRLRAAVEFGVHAQSVYALPQSSATVARTTLTGAGFRRQTS